MGPRTPLLKPGDYFSDREDVHLPSLAVFTLFVVASVVMTVVMVQLLFDQITGVPKGTRWGVLFLAIPGLVVGLVVGWFVVAAIMHFLGGNASNTGTFADALAVAGWAYAPNLLAIPFRVFQFRSKIESKTITATDPEQLEAQLEVMQWGSGRVEVLIYLVVIGWSVYILAHGISKTHNASYGSAISAAVLVGIGSFLLGLL
ncbi:Yip1 family protein [Natrinema sp. H-ect4]|uniref:Yip1 family protein n=1 Tax=Natrinema sp. H-ect4 TaxID=3242699 RepID=UPI0035A99F3C